MLAGSAYESIPTINGGRKAEREKKTPDSLERDSGVDEAYDGRRLHPRFEKAIPPSLPPESAD